MFDSVSEDKNQKLDRVAERGANPFATPEREAFRGLPRSGDQVCLPSLQIEQAGGNPSCTYYQVNSGIAKIYEKYQPAIVRVNTLDPTSDARIGSTAGTGFFVSKDGALITDYHVVENARAITVRLADGKVYDAKVTAVDAKNDMALLTVQKKNPFESFPTVEIAENSKPAVTRTGLVALGHPENSSDAYVSELTVREQLPLGKVDITGGAMRGEDLNRPVISMLGNVKHGNSGAPLFDIKTGKVVGNILLGNGVDAYANRVEEMNALLEKAGLRTAPAQASLRFQPSSENIFDLNLPARVRFSAPNTILNPATNQIMDLKLGKNK